MQTSAIILQDSLHYGYILFGGLTATVAYNLFSSILRALGDSKTPFVAIMISSMCNILLDCICIFLLQTGVEGVCCCNNFCSQTLSAVICCCHIQKIRWDSSYAEGFQNGFLTQLDSFEKWDSDGLYEFYYICGLHDCAVLCEWNGGRIHFERILFVTNISISLCCLPLQPVLRFLPLPVRIMVLKNTTGFPLVCRSVGELFLFLISCSALP